MVLEATLILGILLGCRIGLTIEHVHRPPEDAVLILEVTLLTVVLLGGCRIGLTEEEQDIVLIVWILDVLPRFLLCFCCDNREHCAKVRQQGPAGVAAGRKILGELAELNAEIAAHLTGPKVKFVSTGDLLTGVEDSSRGTLMDALYETWNQDAVHGERIAYTKIGLALLKLINKKNKNNPNKRSRENCSPSGGGFGGDEGGEWTTDRMVPLPPPLLLQGRDVSEAARPTLLFLVAMTAAGAAPLAAEAATAATISGGTTVG